MAKRKTFVGTPSLDIHVESFSGIECLWALALEPLHPPGQPKLFESLRAILMASAKEGKRATETVNMPATPARIGVTNLTQFRQMRALWHII